MPNKKRRSTPSESYSIANLLSTPVVAAPSEEAMTISDLMDDDEEKLAKFLEFLASESLATYDAAAITRSISEIENSQVDAGGSASFPDWEEAVLPPQAFATSADDASSFTAPLVAPLSDTLASAMTSSSAVAESHDDSAEVMPPSLPSAPTSSIPAYASKATKIKLLLRRVDFESTRSEPVSTTSAASAVTLTKPPVLRLRIPAKPLSASHIEGSAVGVKRARDIAEDYSEGLINTWLAKLKSLGFTEAEIEKLGQHPLGSKNILTIAKTYSWLTKFGFNHEQINALGTEGGPKAVMMIILKWEELKKLFTHAQIIKIMNHPASINKIDKVIEFAKKSMSESAAASTSLAFAASSSISADKDLRCDN